MHYDFEPQSLDDCIPLEKEMVAVKLDCGHFDSGWIAHQVGKSGVWCISPDGTEKRKFFLNDILCMGPVYLADGDESS
jgi:hypothetical protein